ncbi:EamA family transporter [Zobellella sp. DQSA1]|uniref:EamA family transporter n=1 Tax=Zobellella sp. DQSA1 TaxID=3342386 RepID=UPI0035BFCC9F
MSLRILLLIALAMLAFAGNSLLCRLALKETAMDAASFTTVRLFSGTLMLWLLQRCRRGHLAGDWCSALALFAYAACFSFAYLELSAATGALLLFGAVQLTMMGAGLWRGERLHRGQQVGAALALLGLVWLLLPGLAAPPLASGLLMLAAGLAWGLYSLWGRGQREPLAATAGNFARALLPALGLSLLLFPSARWEPVGLAYAVASGALASGLGYALWYAALPALRATSAATVQLSVPVLAAFGGVLLLAEPLGWRLLLSSLVVLGGVALVIRGR